MCQSTEGKLLIIIIISIISKYYYSAVELKKTSRAINSRKKVKLMTVLCRPRTGVRLSEIKRVAEEQCLEPSFEGDVRLFQTRAAETAKATHLWNVQLELRSGTELTTTVHVCHMAQCVID